MALFNGFNRGMGGSNPTQYGQQGIGGSSIPGLDQFMNASGGASGPSTFDQMNPQQTGMDVLGSLKQHSNFATRFQNNPMSYGGS